MANMVMNPPTESTAAPLVQPLATCEPTPNNNPPAKAHISRFLLVIFGLCSVLIFSLPEIDPEIKAPTNTPKTSNTNQLFMG